MALSHEMRVPVEHRLFGVDRRSVPYALVGMVVIALWAWVLPWIDDQVAWDDPIRAGQAIQLTDNVTMTAPPGWGVVAGLRTSDRTRGGTRSADQTVLVKDGVVFSVLQGPFGDGARRLLDQAELITGVKDGFRTSGKVQNVTSASGLRGVAQNFATARTVGTVTAFVVDGVGIDIQVVGPEAQVAALAGETAAMINSLADNSSGS